MILKGSCHCNAVRFTLESRHPYPFNVCYCNVCRKTAGSGGYSINLSGDNDSLEVDGREYVTVYFKAPWVEVHAAPSDRQYGRYPEESIAAWHERLGLESDC